jgi:hypothetical protein
MPRKRKKRRTPPRDPNTGLFLSKAARARRRKSKGKSKRKRRGRGKGYSMARGKRGRRRGRRSGGGKIMSTKQKFELCAASAALGYVEENTDMGAKLKATMPNAKPAKRHLVQGLVGHYVAKSFGRGAFSKWIDRLAGASLVVGSYEAGQAKLSLEGGGDNPYDVAEVAGSIDERG